jgi:hypothetical protein
LVGENVRAGSSACSVVSALHHTILGVNKLSTLHYTTLKYTSVTTLH